jgi:peptidoglycan-associated lipoprotein
MTKMCSLISLAATLLVACAHEKPPPPPAEPATVAEAAPRSVPAQPAPPSPPIEAPGPAPAEIAPVSVYFEFDRAELTEESRAALRSLLDRARQRSDVQLRVEGNCDERGTTEYNLALGQRRAEAAKKYLSSLGMDPSRITAVSYGKERARSVGQDEAAWRENRRDDLVTTGKLASGVAP